MKRSVTLFFLLFIIMITAAHAQLKSNLVFFTEQGESFTVILNGQRQNDKPETNVKVTDLIAPSYKLKIIFEDNALGQIDKTIIVNQGMEASYVIKQNNKNQYVVRFMNEVTVPVSHTSTGVQQTPVYNAPAPAQTITQTTITETYTELPDEVSMNINMIDPGVGVNINMNMNVVNGVQNPSLNQTTTTTTYTTTTTQTTDYQHVYDNAYEEVSNQPVYVMPGYNGRVGCPYPIHPDEFQRIKHSISTKSFDDTRLTIAKQVISTNCMLSTQVKEIMLLFSFEDTRLELAKYAYGYTFDIDNFYQLNDAFTFESSIEELDQYIRGFSRR
jgi:hypothetical protein